MNSLCFAPSWLVRSWTLAFFALLLALVPQARAQFPNLAFTVTPGGTINIQNLNGEGWYFYNNPTPSTATMARVTEDLQTVHAWGSANFRQDLNGLVSKVNPREFLRVNAGSTPTGSVIRITYHDVTFDSNYLINITVQSGTAQVLSINRLDPNPSSADTARWEITFDRAVAGVRTQNLAFVYPNNGQAAPTITNVVPSTSAYLKWTVIASTAGRTVGTIGLNWIGKSIEMPPAAMAFTGQTYDMQAPVPTTFSMGRFRNIDIRNVTDDAWYFTGPPALATTTMSRLSEDDSTAEAWNSATFGPDATNSERNRIARNQSLRINSGDTPIGTTIVVNYVTPDNVPKTIHILVTSEAGVLLSMTRLDPSPTSSRTLRWLVTFDRPVAGVRPLNFGYNNFTGVSATATTTPDAASGFRNWTLTVTMNGDGTGPISPGWQASGSFFHPEAPFVGNAVGAEIYDLNPLEFSVPPNGTIDIENFYVDRLRFKAGPTPGSAQMFRVGSTTIGELPWGTAGFNYINNSNAANYVVRNEYLRVTAGATPVGTTIVMRAYRDVSLNDTGFEIRVKVEVPDAQVLSLDIIDPSPTVANSVRWDATFNKAMSGVSAANFSFINVAQIQPTPTITSVVVVPGTGDTVWRVTADTTGTGTGLLGLRYRGHANETPNAPNSFTGQSYDFSSYPLITAHPTPLSAIIVTGGQAPTLSVTATIRTGETLHYHWRKGTSAAPNPDDPVVATTPAFTPPTNVPGHHSYYCRVFTIGTNGQPSGFFAHSLTSTMHVYDPPEIVTQPADIALPPGGSGTINLTTTGTELQYEWFAGDSGDRAQPITTTTVPSYTTPELTANARYWVLVSNALGSAHEVESATVTARVITTVELAQTDFTPVVAFTIENMKLRAFDSEGIATPGATITFVAQALGHLNGTTPGGNFGGALAAGGSAEATATTDSEGWATAPGMWTNTKTGPYQVIAKSQGPTTAISAAMTIVNQPDAPAAFAWITQPSPNAVAGVAFATQPTLTLHDVWENLIGGATVVAKSNAGAIGALQGTTTVQSVNGQVTFTDLAHPTAEILKLRITSGDAVAISQEITVVPGPAASVTAVGGTLQGTRPGTEFALPLIAKVADAHGNGIAGATVKFESPGGQVSASFPQGDTVVTDAFGRASVVAQASPFAGSHIVTATATQHPLLPAAVFQLRNFSKLQEWRFESFSTWEDSGDAANTATPFNDGVPNLLKYAFNLNPKAADYALMSANGARGLPMVGMDAQGRLTVTFVRRKASTLPGVSYAVQFSNDVGAPFAENPSAIMSTPVSIDAIWERVTVTDSVAATDANAKRFTRVQVSEL